MMKDLINLLTDRKIEGEFFGQFVDRLGGGDPFGDRLARAKDLG